MAIDLEAIKRRMKELSGERRNSSVQLWKPAIGEYKIRGLPWKNPPEGTPFLERQFYYIGGNQGILAPAQFGLPDPVNLMIRKLFSTKDPTDRQLAKKLLPKPRIYMPLIVRGSETDGVLVWSFGKFVYQRLLGFFIDEDYGNILDPIEGYDLKVTITQQVGKQFVDTTVDCKKQCKLHEDPEQMKKWLDAVPDLDNSGFFKYMTKTPEEIEKMLNDWLNGPHDEQALGTERGSDPDKKDELDKLVDEVKPAEQPKKPRKAKSASDESDAVTPRADLDAAFKDLMD